MTPATTPHLTSIGINGFGRIGRLIMRIMYNRGDLPRMINVRSGSFDNIATLIKYDSIYGRFPGRVEVSERGVRVDGQEIIISKHSDPAMIPWADNSVEIVVESTGQFNARERAIVHLRTKTGARKVLISAPSDDADFNVLLGVNEQDYDPTCHDIVSNASCTTNSLAPVVKVIHEAFGVEQALLSTIHSYTNDQRILDGTHKDPRRSRAAGINIIPTTTGAAKAVGNVLPDLKGIFDGIALRVPTPTGSLSDVTFLLSHEVSEEEVNAVLREASETDLRGIVAYTEDPIVLQDIVGDSHSAIVDGQLTKTQGRLLKLCIWYDNEWGYSERMVDVLTMMQRTLPAYPEAEQAEAELVL